MLIRRLVCMITLGPSRGAWPSGGPKRPNVLFIAIDDLNDWIGCLGGHPQGARRTSIALSRRGVLFSNAHCQAPICNPSRVSLLTGVRPSTSGVYELSQPHHLSPVLKMRSHSRGISRLVATMCSDGKDLSRALRVSGRLA
ncbi:MAG: hypothetical protein CM1200mP29_01360 [Verrucomicrobiota bacterium]|nr:MAG: hypothetical protein CM1200mP29_01360 [Verrucomicrobiota bacterium]